MGLSESGGLMQQRPSQGLLSSLFMLTGREDNAWKAREQGAEAQYVRQKEQEQLAALRDSASAAQGASAADARDRDFEGGFGGQEDLEDRYATTSGEH
ncbi:hypothetical protein DAEQUDRAFT_766554 [Daedalea quercina L-15889]|uniref:ATPase inhibitor, mitochondrial n=1 Tax=Daedalea quercina L-15889 TaxID=1314783 RepID=A0A165PG40_9APHY|nr:hypothetical protein DAEQUDRAFT_766554 [Daedalea quercina L-15889]